LRERLPQAPGGRVGTLRVTVVTIFATVLATVSSVLAGYILEGKSFVGALRSSVGVGVSFALVYVVYVRWQTRQSD
jgi:hypothetical protein